MKKFYLSSVMALGALPLLAANATDNELSQLIANAADGVVNLDAKVEYTLSGSVDPGQKAITINGNGATIKVTENGQIVSKASLVLDNVKLDASASTMAPIAMATKEMLTAADTTTFATWSVVSDTVRYTAAEADTYNTTNAEAITAGTLTAVKEGDIKSISPKDVFKYAGASNKVFESQLIAIRNSEVKTASSIVSGGNAPWALRTLEINNSIIETSAKSGKAFINWEEGASQIKDIVIKNSSLFADSAKTEQRFHRYSAQVDPWRVWGLVDGLDANKNIADQNTWTLENNTIVNLCGNKEFSNNIKNTAATTFTFKGNVFANSWRINKLGSNVTRNFVVTDNAICGGVQAVDGTDASKWATEDKEMGVVVNDSVKNFIPDAYSWTADQKYGDPRWAAQIGEKTEISRMIAGVDTLVLKSDVQYTLNAPAIAEAQKTVVIEGNGATITANEAGQFIVRQGLVLDNVKLSTILTPIAQAAKEALTKADTAAFYTEIVTGTEKVIAKIDTTYTDETKTEIAKVDTTFADKDVFGMKYAGASNKVFESQLIAIRNSEVKTASSIVSGGNAPWALRTLEINNSIIETSAKSGKAFINWEEGASQIKDIVIKNSTLFADSAKTEQRFHRYSAQVDPYRVWGLVDGLDANKNIADQNTWTLENNTIVNLCGNKEFSNNIKNTAATTFTFKGNVFANSWRINKLGSNVTRNFEVADNAICGGINDVDGTDASKWATVDTLMNIDYTFANGIDFHPGESSYAAKIGAGDPRWAVEYVEPTGIEAIKQELEMTDTRKVMINGQLMIIRNGRSYNAAGVQMK